MTYEPGSPEQLFEQRIDGIVRDLEDICKLALDPEQVDLVRSQDKGIGRIKFRAELILSFLDAAAPKLRVVR